MTMILRAGTGLIGIVLGLLGLGFLLAPAALAPQFHIQPIGAAGLNTLRGDFGTMFLGMAGFALYGALTGNGRYLVFPAAALACVFLGRGLGLVLDGVSAPSIPAMAAEAAMAATLYLAHRRLSTR